MADTTSASADLSEFLSGRYIKPGDLLRIFNPQRLRAEGFGTDAIGGDPASTGPFYVFVTCPDLNILGEGAKTVLGLGSVQAPEALANLLTGGAGPIKLITNLVEQISVSDVTLDTHSVAEGWDGSKLSAPKSTLNSRQDGTVQLEFQEWSGLPITLLHKLWVDYIEGVTKGTISPKLSSPDYITQRILDYACSIYYFQTLPDGRTIEFGTRFTGCFPTAVPYSPWNGKIGTSEAIKVTVPYAYSFMEPMDPAIFNEFNTSMGNAGVSIQEVRLPDSGRRAYAIDFAESSSHKPLENFL